MNKKPTVNLSDVLEFISALGKGDFSKELGTTDDATLAPIIHKLNQAAKELRAQASQPPRDAHLQAEMDLKKALNSLESTSKFLEQTGEMAKVGGWELDLKTGEVHMTRQTQLLHDIDENYVPPKYSTGGEWYPPEAWPTIQAAVKAAIEEGIPYDLESPFITAKGRKTWVRVQGFPVVENGKVIKLRGTFQDITERKQAEKENKMASESMGFGTWKFDPVTNALEWDKQMYALYGVDEKDFSGAYDAWENTLTPEAKEQAVKELGLALRGEKEFNTEFEIKIRNGEVRSIAARATVIRNQKNEPIKMIGFNWDVTQRVQSEKKLKEANLQIVQASKLASLGEMSAGVAHEINNPLAIIQGTINLLPKYLHDPDTFSSKIQVIKKSCERISRIVSGLKKFSRSCEKITFAAHPLSAITKEALTLTEVKSKRSSTPVSFQSTTEASILCNEIEIEQVLINLINNAIDAVKETSEKWVKVSLYEDKNSVVFQVMDSGKGIPVEIRQKIFDPFFTTKKVGDGTGLGLSISKGILEEHHATISLITNCPNTCFEVRFPKVVC